MHTIHIIPINNVLKYNIYWKTKVSTTVDDKGFADIAIKSYLQLKTWTTSGIPNMYLTEPMYELMQVYMRVRCTVFSICISKVGPHQICYLPCSEHSDGILDYQAWTSPLKQIAGLWLTHQFWFQILIFRLSPEELMIPREERYQ